METESYCGLNCGECAAYIATKTNDEELRKTLVIRWNEADWTRDLERPLHLEDITCHGCKSSSHMAKCDHCGIRNCISTQNMESCGLCAKYPCESISKHLEQMPAIKQKLDAKGDAWRLKW